MCNLSDTIEERGIEQGIEQGIQAMIETYQELGGDKTAVILQVVKKFAVPEEVAKEKVEQYWK